MDCPSCKTRNNYYHKYCYNCGKKLIEEPEQVTANNNENKNNDEALPEIDHINSEPIVDKVEGDYANPAGDNDETAIAGDDDSASNDSNDIFNNNDPFIDESFASDFDPDLENTLPLKRYVKQGKRGVGFFRKLLSAVVYLLMAACLTVAVYIAYTKLLQPGGSPSSKPGSNEFIDYIANYESVALDDMPATKITIYTIKGERVKILDKLLTVKDGKAEVTFKNTELYALEGNEKTDKGVNVTLDVVLSADGYFKREEKLTFPVAVPYAPLKVISPGEPEALVEGSNYNMILEVKPGSDVTVNGENYSHMIDENGLLNINLNVPADTVNTYTIKVSTQGYVDLEQDVVLKRQDFGFPFIIDQIAPVKAEGGYAVITGTTDPKATIRASLELKEDPAVDPETGKFTINVKVSGKGLIPLVLTASLEGHDDAVLNLALENSVSESEYTRSAWAPDYNQLKNKPGYLNGTIFLIEGTVKSIISSGEKSIFIVNGSDDASAEQLYYVEYWGTFRFMEGDNIRVFGNRWDSHDEMPRILAKHLY